MPLDRSTINCQHLASSSTVSSYHFYDLPPGPDKFEECRAVSDHQQAEENKNDILPSKRRSWADVVERRSTCDQSSTITDISSLADSVSASKIRMGAGDSSSQSPMSNNARRRSWEELINENELIDNGLKNRMVKIADTAKRVETGRVPSDANPELHLMTVRNDGRLARVHLYNKKRPSDSTDQAVTVAVVGKNATMRKESLGESSKNSTVSEFILLPNTGVLNASASSHGGDVSKSVKRVRKEFGAKVRSKWWPCSRRLTRKTTFFMFCTFALFFTTAVLGFVLRRYIAGKTKYEFDFPTQGERDDTNALVGQQTVDNRAGATLRLVVIEPSSAEFRLTSTNPHQDVKTVVDFAKKLVISRHLAGLPNYCFITHLNESAFPDTEALKTAADNALGKERPIVWRDEWKFQAEPINENLLDSLYFDQDSREKCGRNLYWLQKVDRNLSSLACRGCYRICLPSYGVTKLPADQGKPVLTPAGRDCFWLAAAGTIPAASVITAPLRPTSVNNGFNTLFNAGQQGQFSGGQTNGFSSSIQSRPMQMLDSPNSLNGYRISPAVSQGSFPPYQPRFFNAPVLRATL